MEEVAWIHPHHHPVSLQCTIISQWTFHSFQVYLKLYSASNSFQHRLFMWYLQRFLLSSFFFFFFFYSATLLHTWMLQLSLFHSHFIDFNGILGQSRNLKEHRATCTCFMLATSSIQPKTNYSGRQSDKVKVFRMFQSQIFHIVRLSVVLFPWYYVYFWPKGFISDDRFFCLFSENCMDTGRHCGYHVPRGDCKTMDIVRQKCRKSCGLC